MVSVAELLNPEPPRAPLPTSRPAPVSPTQKSAAAFQNKTAPVRPSIHAIRMADNSRGSRSKVKGVINFPPHENLDEASLREVHRFQVHPLGSIRETCERIPYNSGKKDFFSKTGREGFEVFHYDFKVPGDDTNYTVMWDYSVGLVRMTSFFKCRGYSKTTPAKMLNMNPGLKDITYSITGGSIKAQGYWMPYICARAICATFCHKISGALIPLFGPQFPHECIPERAPGHGRMIIRPELVAQAKSDAAALFRLPACLPSPRTSRSASPLPSQRSARIPDYDYHSDHHDPRMLLSPYTDTDYDYHPASEPYGCRGFPTVPPMRIPTSIPNPMGPAPVPTPMHSPAWAAVNNPPAPSTTYHHHRRGLSNFHEELAGLNVSASANPMLSAIPRSPTPTSGGGNPGRWHPYYPRPHNHHQHQHHHSHHHRHTSSPVSTSLPERDITLAPLRLNKRPFDQVDDIVPDNHHTTHGNAAHPNDDDHDYDASSSRAGSDSPASSTASSHSDQHHHHRHHGDEISRATLRMPTTVAVGGVDARGPNSTPPSPASVAGTATTHAPRNDTSSSVRRASEQEVAMMLLQMSGGGGYGSSPSMSMSPSQSQSGVGSAGASASDDSDTNTTNNNNDNRVGGGGDVAQKERGRRRTQGGQVTSTASSSSGRESENDGAGAPASGHGRHGRRGTVIRVRRSSSNGSSSGSASPGSSSSSSSSPTMRTRKETGTGGAGSGADTGGRETRAKMPRTLELARR